MDKRIIHVLRRYNRDEWGGTETVVFGTSHELAKRGYQFKILCPVLPGEPNKSIEQGISLERYKYFYPYLGLKKEKRALLDRDGGALLSFSAMFKLLREKPLNLLHCHSSSRLGGIVRTVARMRKLPYVISIHGGIADKPEYVTKRHLSYTKGTLGWGKPFGMLLGSRRVFRDASAIFCVGVREYELMKEKHPGVRVEHIPNGVNTNFFAGGNGDAFREKHGIAPDEQIILNVGRIMSQKNQAFLVTILPEILKYHPRARLVFLGAVIDPAYCEKKIINSARNLGVSERVTVVDGVPPRSEELADAYASCDVFVLPSTYETFGIVILEAWAARKAVVTSKAGGMLGYVEDGKDALLVEPNDSKGFVEAITRLLGNGQLCSNLAQAGNKKAREGYDWTIICDKIDAIYTELIEGSKR